MYKEKIVNGNTPVLKQLLKNHQSNINDLLEETRRSLSENYMMDDDTIYMDSNSVDSFVSSRTSAAVPNGVSPNDVPQDIMNALTRNYSDLMKKIDEKKGR